MPSGSCIKQATTCHSGQLVFPHFFLFLAASAAPWYISYFMASPPVSTASDEVGAPPPPVSIPAPMVDSLRRLVQEEIRSALSGVSPLSSSAPSVSSNLPCLATNTTGKFLTQGAIRESLGSLMGAGQASKVSVPSIPAHILYL